MSKPLRHWLVPASLLLLAWLVPPLVAWRSAPLFVKLGPNDSEYASGLRDDWERDGATIFHWTGTRARLELPARVVGSGHLLRLRARRHFVEPAHVKLLVEGQTVGEFDLSAESSREPQRPYVVYEVALPELDGRHDFAVHIEAPSENPRPLGIALDWVEIESRDQGGFALDRATRVRLWLAVVAALAFVRLSGSSLMAASGVAAVGLAGMIFGLFRDILALERILRLGLPCFIVVGLLALLFSWRAGWRARAADASFSNGSALTALVLLALAVRLVLLLHPQFFYPDVRVHALFARELAKGGLSAFLENFTANQYRFSLGLQQEQGHWYAFPYPPVFYGLAWPLIRFLGYAPEVAVSLLPAALNSLEVLVVFTLGIRVLHRPGQALAAAAAVPLLPIFMVRLSLAYFPALVGHFVDAVLLCYLAYHWERMARWRTWLGLALLLALALLTYTQALLNFGLILPLFLALQVWRDGTPEGRRRQLGLLAAGVLGVLLSLTFYGRYARFFVDMHNGVPMAQERILLEKQARGPQQAPQTADDPFAGPSLDLVRGLKKAAWRLYVFYGWLAPLIVAAGCLMWRGLDPDHQRLVLAWASVYLLLNLASGGLPGPNLVRYNKDLEIVAPLTCLALGAGWGLLRQANVWVARLGSALYLGFAGRRALAALTDRFFVDRSSGL